MDKKEAKKILKDDYREFLKLPKNIKNDNSIKDLALHEAMRQEEDQWMWQNYLLERGGTSNNDKYMTLKIAKVTNHNIVYMDSISSKMKNDKEFFKELYRVRPKYFSWGYLEYGSKKIRSDFDLALIAIEKNFEDFDNVDSSLLKNLEFLAKALNVNPKFISKYEYSEKVLKNAEFVKHVNKKNNELIRNYLASNEFSKDPFDNEDSLEEEEGKVFMLYVFCWFFLSEHQDGVEQFKLTPRIKEKTLFFIERCDFKSMPLLKNVSPEFFKVNKKNKLIEGALKFTNKGYLPSALILQLPKVAIFKAIHIGVELLSLSSFVDTNNLSSYEKAKEATLRKFKLDFLTLDDNYAGRWRESVAVLFLSNLASCASIYSAEGDEEKGVHYYCTYILNLIRNKFQSNQFIYSTVYEENFDLSAAFSDLGKSALPEEQKIGLTKLQLVFKAGDCSLVKYKKINEHFETAIQTFIEKININQALLNKITNFLIEYYGLIIDFHQNQFSGNRREMLKFFSFESNSNINEDFLKFIQKDKEWLCGINSESFKIPKEAMSDYFDDEHDEEKKELKSAKLDIDGYQPINPKNLSNGILARVNEIEFWTELHFKIALPISNKKINKNKEFIFLDEMESMKAVTGLGSFYVDTMNKVIKEGKVNFTQAEGTLLKKGELYAKNIGRRSKNLRLLDESSLELYYSINYCLPAEILYHLKEEEDVVEVATFKFSSDLISIKENYYTDIIKIIILKYKSGYCEGLAIPFRPQG